LLTNSSDLIRAESDRQKKADCAYLTRKPLPPEVVIRIRTIPEAVEKQTPDEKVMLQWYAADRDEVAKRQGYCGA
jgi:hypothetical protein